MEAKPNSSELQTLVRNLDEKAIESIPTFSSMQTFPACSGKHILEPGNCLDGFGNSECSNHKIPTDLFQVLSLLKSWSPKHHDMESNCTVLLAVETAIFVASLCYFSGVFFCFTTDFLACRMFFFLYYFFFNSSLSSIVFLCYYLFLSLYTFVGSCCSTSYIFKSPFFPHFLFKDIINSVLPNCLAYAFFLYLSIPVLLVLRHMTVKLKCPQSYSGFCQ